MQIARDFFLKNRLAVMRLSRDLLSVKPDEQLQTVDYYVEKLEVSRGTVQKAMQFLIEQECITTHFRGHLGTFLLTKNNDKLWEYSGFGTLSGAMSLPLNKLVAGLATGVCDCMKLGGVPFNCIFMQGSLTRMKGLNAGKYDFVVSSKLTASVLLKELPDVEMIMTLPGCAYAGRYILLFANPSESGIEEGMSVAVDRNSFDQSYLTELLCADKRNLRFNEMTYIETRLSVKRGESDVTVCRADALESLDIGNDHVKDLFLPQFTKKEIDSFTDSVILARRDNYGISDILQTALRPSVISNSQKKVMNGSRNPSYY